MVRDGLLRNPPHHEGLSPASPYTATWLRHDVAARRVAEAAQDIVELFAIRVADGHGAAGVAVVDADAESQNIADAAFERERAGILLAGARPRPLRPRPHRLLT